MKENNNLNIENENRVTEKKAKKKWSKKKKAGVACLVIILLAAITAFSLIVVAPAAHLANKYNEPIYKFEIHSFVFPHIYYGEPVIIYPHFYFSNPRWEFEKDGIVFNVEYAKDAYRKQATYKFGFFDDMQLEELEQWSTEYLQKNIYEKIAGVRISARDIFKVYGNDLITEEAIPAFFAEKERYVIYISVYDLAANEQEKEVLKKSEIKQDISKKLNVKTDNIELVVIYDKSAIKRHRFFISEKTDYWPSNESVMGY